MNDYVNTLQKICNIVGITYFQASKIKQKLEQRENKNNRGYIPKAMIWGNPRKYPIEKFREEALQLGMIKN